MAARHSIEGMEVGGADLAIRTGSQQAISEKMGLALEQVEEALCQVQRIAIEEIRDGLEASNHIEAAERDMRNALRQLVLAERELHSGAQLPPALDRHTIAIGEPAAMMPTSLAHNS